jgi:hypothetical protein
LRPVDTGHTGTPKRLHTLSTRCTSSTEAGLTTPAGAKASSSKGSITCVQGASCSGAT